MSKEIQKTINSLRGIVSLLRSIAKRQKEKVALYIVSKEEE